VAAARVSTTGADAARLADEAASYGLIRYLLKHRHGSPFEHGLLTFFVQASAESSDTTQGAEL